MHIFIISWAGQHSNAVSIARQVAALAANVSIVYSDPDPDLALDAPCQLIRRPNDLFWGDKFKACLDACGDAPMLVIHADCHYPDWAQLVQKCQEAVTTIPGIGVWSPKVDFVPWRLEYMRLKEIANTDLVVVTHTDGIVFYLSPSVIKRMKLAHYDQNLYGWGIEAMFLSATYARGMFAVIDQSVLVRHPKSRGYPSEAAQQQCALFLNQLDLPERIQLYFLQLHRFSSGGNVPRPQII